MPVQLPQSFYSQNTHKVAKDLLGKLLVREWRGEIITVRINEVECYIGEDDRACHASRGRTPRTETMYGEPGRAYVYLIYGMHHCLNIVTEKKDFPAAVLIRGVLTLAPASLTPDVKEKTSGVFPAGALNGPGKICRVLRITRALNGEDLVTSRRLYIADDGYKLKPDDIISAPRINVDYAGEDAKLPWRYLFKLH